MELGEFVIKKLEAINDLYVAASNGSVRPETINVMAGMKNLDHNQDHSDHTRKTDAKSETVLIRDAKDCKWFMRELEKEAMILIRTPLNPNSR